MHTIWTNPDEMDTVPPPDKLGLVVNRTAEDKVWRLTAHLSVIAIIAGVIIASI